MSGASESIARRDRGRRFHAHETERTRELEGLPLAGFWQRALGYLIDVLLAIVLWVPSEVGWRILVLHEDNVQVRWDFHELGNIIFLILYFGVANYAGNGQTPGKWVARTRAVSLTGKRMGIWQSIERALGYGAAVLEGGLGLLQYFWSANRMCAQDRLAETIVIDVRKKARAERQQEEAV
ncbi:MAG: RDD family protein [Acidobacteriaceae bacterium]|nr:RDD family protein [Acidobacteriaceae bacterium]